MIRTFLHTAMLNSCRGRAVLLCCLAFFLQSGCADKQLSSQDSPAPPPQTDTQKIHIHDPQGPIPAPALSPDLPVPPSAAKSSEPSFPATENGALYYTVQCTVEGLTAASDPLSQKNSEAQTADILDAFTKASILYTLQDSPPASLVGLEQRLSVAFGEARDVMNSQGYYLGRVSGNVEQAAPSQQKDKNGQVPKAVVNIRFFPGQRYTVRKSAVIYTLPPGAQRLHYSKNGRYALSRLPKSLGDVGLEKGSPATAAALLAAVDRALERFPNNGFPFASVSSTRFIVDHASKMLEAEIKITPGEYVRMGKIEQQGAPNVRDSYVKNLQTWREGQPWSKDRAESFRENLRQSGLFQSIDIAPSENDGPDGVRTVVTKLSAAPERTIGGALKYHSDFGPGVQAFWEHRNLTGHSDSLRIETPVWMDMQEITASYRIPFFLRRDQDFIAGSGFLHQDTDAYELTSAAASAGVERHLSRHWSVSAQGSVQGGNIKEPSEPRRDYIMYGLPLGATFDTTNSLLDAVTGQRVTLSAAPYTGQYMGNFSILRSRLEGRAFLPLKGEDELVLALRGVLGVINGASSDKVPPSVRFYSGGGGSVRGYEYQSIGPRDKDRKPLGGGSLAEFSAETRWKVRPEWGLVAFLDGGTAYPDTFSSVDSNTMRWGAGVGARYYTAIGPVRVDVATPLNPRSDDDAMQFYISIGQSF